MLRARWRHYARPALRRASLRARPITARPRRQTQRLHRLPQPAVGARLPIARALFQLGRQEPAGERIIYGTYTIYDTSDCRKSIEKANTYEPRDAELEAAASAYAEAVSQLAPLLKEADDYYPREDFKDDKMAKGRALHPRLVAAWDAFAAADLKLRGEVEAINDKRALAQLAAIEQSEGRKAHYYVNALMIQAKRVLRAENAAKLNLAAIAQALNDVRRNR